MTQMFSNTNFGQASNTPVYRGLDNLLGAGNVAPSINPSIIPQMGTGAMSTMQAGYDPMAGLAGLGNVGGSPDFWSKDAFFGVNGQQGWGNMALGAAGALGNAFMGMKQYGLAKDALAQSQAQFEKNYAAQKQTINAQMEDRQKARVAATEGAAESVEDYMKRNAIK